MSEVIFTTIHGSGLYGLATEHSDIDIFTVTTSRNRKARQKLRVDAEGRNIDKVEVGLSTFLRRANSGSHQSVEALFSGRKVWMRPEHRDFIESSFVCGEEVFAKYERTIKKFCYGDFKRRRHACRLSLNLYSLRERGRFDPEMTQAEIALANGFAKGFEGDDLVAKLL